MLVDVAEPEHLAEGGDGAVGGEGAGGGQLRLCVDDAGPTTRARTRSRRRLAPRADQGVQPELLQRAEHGGHVAVEQRFALKERVRLTDYTG